MNVKDKVGNGGFCIRSKKLLTACSNIFKAQGLHCGMNIENSDDYWTGIAHRKELEDQGMRFATTDVAKRFAIESWGPGLDGNVWDGQFGFHSKVVKLSRWEEKEYFCLSSLRLTL